MFLDTSEHIYRVLDHFWYVRFLLRPFFQPIDLFFKPHRRHQHFIGLLLLVGHTPSAKAGLWPEHGRRNPPYPLASRKESKTAFYIDLAFSLDFGEKKVRYLSRPSAPLRFASNTQRATLAATWLWSQVWKGKTVHIYVNLFFPPCRQCSSGPDHTLHYGHCESRWTENTLFATWECPNNSGTSRIIVMKKKAD